MNPDHLPELTARELAVQIQEAIIPHDGFIANDLRDLLVGKVAVELAHIIFEKSIAPCGLLEFAEAVAAEAGEAIAHTTEAGEAIAMTEYSVDLDEIRREQEGRDWEVVENADDGTLRQLEVYALRRIVATLEDIVMILRHREAR